MATGSCIMRTTTRNFAERVVNKLTDKQKIDFGITDNNKKEDAISAIQGIVEFHIGKEPDERQKELLQNEDTFIHDLESYFMVQKVDQNEYKDVMDEYNQLQQTLKKWKGDFGLDFSRLNYIEISEDDNEQEALKDIISVLDSFDRTVFSVIEKYESGKIKSLRFIVKEPQLKSGETSQVKALEAIEKIQKLTENSIYPLEYEIKNEESGETRFIKSNWIEKGWRTVATINHTPDGNFTRVIEKGGVEKEMPAFNIPKGFKRTGRVKYSYNNATIITTPATTKVHGFDPTPDFPVLAAKLGNVVDIVSREFFKEDVVDEGEQKKYVKSGIFFDKDGKRVTDKDKLQDIINSELSGIFTVDGLNNLLDDLEELKEELTAKWGQYGELRFISSELSLFGKIDDDNWITGKPDLLVIDGRGVVHVLDFKTAKMVNPNKGYSTVFKDSIDKYSEQVSLYIDMLKAYGLTVDEDPYLIAVDTFYDSSDHGYNNYLDKENRKDIYVTKKGFLGILDKNDPDREVSLGQYSENEGNPTREDTLTGRKLLYIEPRLHVKGYDENKRKFSDELAALRGPEEGVKKVNSVTFIQQFDDLSADEKNELEWLGIVPIYKQTPAGLVVLSSRDIESRPDIISSQEIQTLANLIMYKVSRTVTKIQNGEKISGLQAIQNANEIKDIVEGELKGKSRKSIIFDYIGLDNLIDYALNDSILNSAYHKDRDGNYVLNEFPTMEQYENGDYDDFEFSFDNLEDYLKQKRKFEKAKWINEHKEQFILAGTAKLMALEDSIVPIKSNPEDRGDTKDTTIPNLRLQPRNIDALNDDGDNGALDDFSDKYLEGLTNLEAWMLGARHYSPKASLAQEIKRIFEDLDLVDGNDQVIMDPYGWGFSMPVDPTMATQTILDTVRNCETVDEMVDALQKLSLQPNNRWVNQILDIINKNETIKTKFYRHFRKDFTTYSISVYQFNKNSGKREIVTRIINMSSAFDTMKQSLGADFKRGNVGTFKINDVALSLVFTNEKGKVQLDTTLAENLKNYIDKLKSNISKIYSDYSKEPGYNRYSSLEKEMYYVDSFKEKKIKAPGISSQEKTIVQSITDILNGVGIMVTEDVVLNYISQKVKGEKTNNAQTLLSDIKNLIEKLIEQNGNSGIPAGLSGNKAYPMYLRILENLSDSVQMHVESSVYQDGKTYYSYTNPSRLQHIIKNLTDAIGSYSSSGELEDTKFGKYLDTAYGRYKGWFKDVKGDKWLCDWLDQLSTTGAARNALAHKVELSFAGNQYRDLGALGFQLSILANYFGSTDEEKTYNGRYRWFALPTMSNKPTNEFIRMLKYGGNGNNSYKKEIIDRVLMNTYQQEMNRIADVLYHFTTGQVGVDKMDLRLSDVKKLFRPEVEKQHPEILNDKETTKEEKDKAIEELIQKEVDELKQRILNRNIQPNDLAKLGTITSGAKFHFLWYLNNEIAENADFAQNICYNLNLLLTPDSKEKENRLDGPELVSIRKTVRNTIESKMDEIVKDELKHMEDIGLFETEEKTMTIPKGATVNNNKITVNGRQISVPGEIVGIKNGKVTYKILKYQEQFGERLGTNKNGEGRVEMEKKLTEFIWQDIAANINIIQITGGDLAYYGNAINYQKRIAQIHSPGLKLMHNEKYDDGYLRSIHISDMKVRDEILPNSEKALTDYLNEHKNNMSDTQIQDYKNMIKIILSDMTNVLSTDGQSYSSPSSIRKKLREQGEWDDTKEKAYQAIIKGDFNINHLGVMLQPSKPFVTSDMAKYSGSPTMRLRRVPLQDKNSEYLIVLAEALARGSGQRSKLVAICDFMEDTQRDGDGRHGIDTVHFASVGKVGVSGVIDISSFDKAFEKRLKEGRTDESKYNDELREFIHFHVRTADNAKQHIQDTDTYEKQKELKELKQEEILYNSDYVDTIPIEDYIIQQEVPAHLLQKNGQLYGSQIRILGITDISKGVEFDITDENGDPLTDETLVAEYKELHAENIRASHRELLEELGLTDIDKLRDELKDKLKSFEEFVEYNNLPYETVKDKEQANIAYQAYLDRNQFESIVSMPIGTPERNIFFKKLHFILQKELSKDAKYGLDMRRACSLKYDEFGNVIDFVVPLMDPMQSKRIQMLINSIIKKKINKQRIEGGPVVQTTAYDKDLHIRFKNKNGGLLLTKNEYEKSEITGYKNYKDYIDQNQDGIAYFECYISVPNEQLERLLTKDDGSMMSFEEAKKALPEDVWKSLTEVIGYRIPTEDKYSMLPLKIMGFVPKAAGQVIMMPQEITYLTGSDFDIDKMYIMLKKFDVKYQSEEDAKRIINLYHNDGGETYTNITEDVKNIIRNSEKILKGDTRYSWTTGVDRGTNFNKAQKFIEWYKLYLLKNTFTEFKDRKSKNPDSARNARNNRILDLQWAVLTHRDTASKMLNPGNFIPQKRTGRMISVITSKVINPETGEIWTWKDLSELTIDELDNLLENADPHNSTLPSSKIYFQRQNMQGTQMVGIFANNNVSHAFMTFQKIGIDLKKGRYDNTFMFDGKVVGDVNIEGSANVLDPQVGFDGRLISKTIASFLAASVDTAKDPVLSDMNINTFTGGVAMMLARLGFDTESIGLFLKQPVIVQLTDLYFKNKTDGFYDGDTALNELAKQLGISKEDMESSDGIKNDELNKSKLAEHLNETDYENSNDNNYQKKVLKGFYRLFQMSRDLQKLTFCTKFNSVSNAVGPSIADTMEDMDKVRDYMDNISTSMFYEPKNDRTTFTEPAEVITSDPILNAFYETTIGPDGASKAIFKHFFPHYYNGFNNVLEHFRKNYFRGNRVPSKLYNQLLDEYLYFLLTYKDSSKNIMPTLPTLPKLGDGKEKDKEKIKESIVVKLVKDYQEVKDLANKYKGKLNPNPLLTESLGANCLRIRKADEFLNADTLIFNGSQLNAEGQQEIRNAWTDLVTMDNPALTPAENNKIRMFGINLFFYTLMRNGFGFSPKTLMHLASVMVRQNATFNAGYFENYIDGIKNLRGLDNELAGRNDIGFIRRFCDQFVRNHSNNKQLVPTIENNDPIISNWEIDTDNNTTILELSAPVDEVKYKFKKILIGEKEPTGFITVIRKENGKLYQDLYKLEVGLGGSKTSEIDGQLKVRYRKTNKLGLVNNFIEYDANDNIDISFFDTIRNDAEDIEEEGTPQDGTTREQEPDEGLYYTVRDSEWTEIRNIILKTDSPFTQKEDGRRTDRAKELMVKARSLFLNNKGKGTPIATLWQNFKDSKNTDDLDQIIKEIEKQESDQDKCNNG